MEKQVNPTLIELKFRDGRNYVHSTDVLKKLYEYLQGLGYGGWDELKISMNSILARSLWCEIGLEKGVSKDGAWNFTVKKSDVVIQGALFESPDHMITERYASKKLTFSACDIDVDARSVTCTNNEGIAVIDGIIDGAKFYLDHVKPEGNPWLFRKASFSSYIGFDSKDYHTIRIQEVREKLKTVSLEYFVDDELFGGGFAMSGNSRRDGS